MPRAYAHSPNTAIWHNEPANRFRIQGCRVTWTGSRSVWGPNCPRNPEATRMAEVSLLIHDLEAVVTPIGTGPLRGRQFGELSVHSPASIAVSGDRIVAVGPPEEILRQIPPGSELESVDGRGRTALPGLIDCHTHPAFLGDRAAEFELRSSGASYEEINTSGGAIRSTVAATRAG